MTSWISSTPETVFQDVCSATSLSQRVAMLPEGPVIVVVPTARQRDDILMQWARHNGRGEPPMIITMAGLYRALAPAVLTNVPRILSDSSVDVLLEQAMETCDLPVGSIRLRASRIVRWAQELRSPAWLRDAAARHPSHRAARQLATAAKIWSAYEELLGSRAADRGTFSRRIVDALQHQPLQHLTMATGDTHSRILVLDTHGVTGVDAQLLCALTSSGWDIAIQFAPELPVSDLAHVSRTTRDLQWFVSQGWHLGAQIASSLPEGERCMVPCASRGDEVRRAVAVCKEAASSGVPLSAIALCVPGDQQYAERLRQACAEAGVPLQSIHEVSLAQTHAASLLHACCRVVTGGWLRTDVERVLREPMLRDIMQYGPSLLLIAREERIVGGNGMQEWIDRIEQRQADMQAIAERGDDDSDHAQRNAQRYGYALRTLRDLRTMLDVHVQGAMDAERFASLVLTKIAASINLEQRSAEHEPQSFNALRDTCSAYIALHRDHELPNCSFATHLYRWWTIVRSTMVARTGRSLAGVRIVRPAELRSGAYQVVVVVGCIEGEFPRTSVQQLDEDVVPDVQKHLAWESMADIAFAAQAGGSTLFMYPTMLEGSPVLASTTIDALEGCMSPRSRWVSADTSVSCIVHPRDLRVDPADVPESDRSQLGDVQAGLKGEAARILAEELARPISPSRLDVATQCPYRFFAQIILRLDDLDIDDARLSPLERGTLLHDVVHRWYRRLRNDAPVEITPAGLRAACVNLLATSFDEQWLLLTRVVDEVLAEQSHIHAFAPVERRALVGDEYTPGLLKRWLALEREDQRASGFMPVLFEHEIEITLEIPTEHGIAAVPVKTRIDRIDLREDRGVFSVSVVDYKSSLSDAFSATNVKKGLASQMPLYLAAVKAWFAQHGIEVQPEAAVYRAFGTALPSPANLDRRVVLADVGSPMVTLTSSRAKKVTDPLNDTLESILTLLHPGIAQIQSGAYPVRPRNNACNTCRVAQVCRKDHWGILVATTDEKDSHEEERNEDPHTLAN